MKIFVTATSLFVLLFAVDAAQAQQVTRHRGWEYGFDVNNRLQSDLSFAGGSRIEFEDEFGLSLTFGYRYNPRFEFQFGFDWTAADYDALLQSSTTASAKARVSGEMEVFTALGKMVYNILEGPLTPFVTGGIGWSFIDSNIPNNEVAVGCWWDPWYGNVCTPYQSSKTTDEFTYLIGAGVRWDFSPTLSLRGAYEKHFTDYSNASGTPDSDLFKAGVAFRY